jgi:hypothetical protein
MPERKQYTERNQNKGEGATIEAKSAKTSMGKFFTLARRIVRVPTHEVLEQQKEYEIIAEQRRRTRRPKSPQ